jgi:hypothetical protein
MILVAIKQLRGNYKRKLDIADSAARGVLSPQPTDPKTFNRFTWN